MSAYFSATETAFSTFNKIRVKNLAEKGNKKAQAALKLADNYDTLLSTILIGNNIVNILASAMGTLLFTELLKSQDLGATVSTAVLTVTVLIFGEISPKSRMKTVRSTPETAAPYSSLPTISPNTTAPTEESATQTIVLAISMVDNVSSKRLLLYIPDRS